MAFDRTYLSGNIGAGSNAPKMYSYRTNDTTAATVAADYFLGAYQVLEKGDIIVASTDEDGTHEAVMLFVTASSSTTVTTDYVAVA